MVVSTQSSGVICELVGIVGDAQYHRWRMLLRELSVVQAQILPRLHGFLEDEYFAFLEARKTMIQRAKLQELQQTTSTYVLINECELIDTEDRLLALLTKKTQISNGELLAIAAFGASSYDNESSSPTEKQQELLCSAEESLQSKAETAAQEALFRYRQISGHHFAFLLFEVNGVALPRVEIELYHRVCPQTCKNFLAFCRGVVPDVTDTERMLGYTGNQVHRVVRDGWIQAGDVAGDGRGDGPCRSIDGLEFADESFDISHNSAGIVSMANTGPHTNGSQFFITLAPQPWLDRKKVAFGRVVSGMHTIRLIGNLETLYDRPCVPCRIIASGAVE